MKPFDLEAALAGAPVITRDRNPAFNVYQLEAEEHRAYPIAVAVITADGALQLITVTESGQYRAGTTHGYDLFMADDAGNKDETI